MAEGDPTGEDLCVGTTNGNTLPEPWPPDSPELREITFAVNPTLVAGTKYAIVVRALDAADSANRALWEMTLFAGGYSGGTRELSNNSGGSWSSQSQDQLFEEYEGAVLRQNFTTGHSTGASSNVYGATWEAQTFTPTVTHDITSVKLYLSRAAGASPGIITVSIKATEPGLPEKPINPTPTDAVDNVALNQATITWEDGGGATSYDVYYGTSEAGLELISEGQTELSLTIQGIDYGSPFGYSKSRAWRIDAVNAGGTTTGDVWTFRTIHSSSFPWERPEDYDPDLGWDWDSDDEEYAWQDIVTAGGGRYKNQIVAVGFDSDGIGAVYFGDI